MNRDVLIARVAQIISKFPCGSCPKCDKDGEAVNFNRCWDMYVMEAEAVVDYLMDLLPIHSTTEETNEHHA